MAGMVTPAHELDESGMEALLSEDFRRRELDAKRLWRAVLAITLQDAAELWPVRFPANWRPPPAKERMQRGGRPGWHALLARLLRERGLRPALRLRGRGPGAGTTTHRSALGATEASRRMTRKPGQAREDPAAAAGVRLT